MPNILTRVDEGDSIEQFMAEQAPETTCPTCKGYGEVDNGVDIYWRPYWTTCPTCKGKGSVIE